MLEDFVNRWLVMIVLFPLVLLVWWGAKCQLRRFRWLPPEPDVRRPAIERFAEAGVLALVCGACLVATVFRTRYANIPWLWVDLPTVRGNEWLNLGIATTGILLGVLWSAWKGRSTPVQIGIIACLIMANIPTFDRSMMFRSPEFKDLQRLNPAINAAMPILFRCVDDTVGADVFINGERIGQTPCETTLGRVLEVVSRNPSPEPNYLGRFGDQFYTPEGELLHGGDGSWRWPDFPDCGFLSMSLHGDHGWVRTTSIISPRWWNERAQWRPAEVRLLAYFPERERRWNELLTQIRLREYRTTDQKWLEALDSFGTPGELALTRAIRVEPEFQPIYDAWTAWKYGIRTPMSTDAAWQVFERIIAESDNPFRKYYQSGMRVRALELLAPGLDQTRLKSEVTWCLSQDSWYPHDWSRPSPLLDRDHLAIDWSWNDDPSRPSALRSLVLNHAVWLLHQSGSGREICEQEFVPLLLRHGQHHSAQALGGPVFQKYVSRFLARRLKDPKWAQFTERSIAGGDGDHWLLTDNSKIAREWRQRNELLLFQAAGRLVDDHRETLSFIFEGFDGQADHRVWRCWQYLLSSVPQPRVLIAFSWQPASKREWLWKYLDRIGPHAPVSAYVDAWKLDPLTGEKQFDDLSLNHAFPRQPPETRQAIFRELSKLLRPPPEIVVGQPRDAKADVARTLARLAEESGFSDEAQKRNWLERLSRDKTKAQWRNDIEFFVRDLRKKLQTGELPLSLVRLLTESSQPNVRSLGLELLEDAPTPELRSLLPTLLQDPDADVRAAAERQQQRFDLLRNREPVAWSTP